MIDEDYYRQMENLVVEVSFTLGVTGYDYLRRKIEEVTQKTIAGTELLCQLVRDLGHVSQEIAEQQALYEVTQLQAHRDARDRAKETRHRLSTVMVVLKLRIGLLRSLPKALQLYVRTLEDGIRDAKHQLETDSIPREAAIPSALSEMADRDVRAQDDDMADLFR